MHWIFKLRYFRSHMLLFRMCFDYFSFNHRSSFLKFYGRIFTWVFTWVFQSFLLKTNVNNFSTALNYYFLSCRVAGIYVAGIYAPCCYCTDDTPFDVGVHFGHQGLDEKMYFHTLSKRSRTWHNRHTIIIKHPYIIWRGTLPNHYGKSHLPWF